MSTPSLPETPSGQPQKDQEIVLGCSMKQGDGSREQMNSSIEQCLLDLLPSNDCRPFTDTLLRDLWAGEFRFGRPADTNRNSLRRSHPKHTQSLLAEPESSLRESSAPLNDEFASMRQELVVEKQMNQWLKEENDIFSQRNQELEREHHKLRMEMQSKQAICVYFQNQLDKKSADTSADAKKRIAELEAQIKGMTAERERTMNEWKRMAAMLKKRNDSLRLKEEDFTAKTSEIDRLRLKLQEFVLNNAELHATSQKLEARVNELAENLQERQKQLEHTKGLLLDQTLSTSECLRPFSFWDDATMTITDGVKSLSSKFQALSRESDRKEVLLVDSTKPKVLKSQNKKGQCTPQSDDDSDDDSDSSGHRYRSPFPPKNTQKSTERKAQQAQSSATRSIELIRKIRAVVRSEIDRQFELKAVVKCINGCTWIGVCESASMRVFHDKRNDRISIAVRGKRADTLYFEHAIPSKEEALFQVDREKMWCRWSIGEDMVEINLDFWIAVYFQTVDGLDGFASLFEEITR